MHPSHDSYIDDSLIATAFPVVIEIPKGSTNKYELDKETGGPEEALVIITEALELYRKLRRGELAKSGKI